MGDWMRRRKRPLAHVRGRGGEDGGSRGGLFLGGGVGEAGGGETAAGFESVDFGGCLIRANTGDAREAEGEAALMAGAGLNDVEGDFENGVGHDGAEAAVDLEGVGEEVLGELGDLDVGEA